jgi:hypothetical protein
MSPKRLSTTDKAASQGRPYHTSTKRAITFSPCMSAKTGFFDRIQYERSSSSEQKKSSAHLLVFTVQPLSLYRHTSW